MNKQDLGYKDRNKTLLELGFNSYKEYITSPLWKSIREKVLILKGTICSECNKFAAIQVHHQSYDVEVLKGNNLDPLVPLCGGCHKTIEFSQQDNKNHFEVVKKNFNRIDRFAPLQKLAGFSKDDTQIEIRAATNDGCADYLSIITVGGQRRELRKELPDTTSNRAYIIGMLDTLKSLPDTENMVIVANSSYMIQSAAQYVFLWQKREWINNFKEPVAHKDLWEDFLKERKRFKNLRFKLLTNKKHKQFREQRIASLKKRKKKRAKDSNNSPKESQYLRY